MSAWKWLSLKFLREKIGLCNIAVWISVNIWCLIFHHLHIVATSAKLQNIKKHENALRHKYIAATGLQCSCSWKFKINLKLPKGNHIIFLSAIEEGRVLTVLQLWPQTARVIHLKRLCVIQSNAASKDNLGKGNLT